MAGEIQIQDSLQVDLGNVHYQSKPTSFKANMTTAFGPTPGSFTAALAGTDVDLSKLPTPPANSTGGMVWFQNQDSANYISYGMFDHGTNKYLEFGELLPGEFVRLRLSRRLGYEYNAGTGTHIASGETWRFKAFGAPVAVAVHAFAP